MTEAITSVEQVTPAWLTEVLRDAGCLDKGEAVSVWTEREQTRSLTNVFHLSVMYSEDAPLSAPPRLFLKISGTEHRSGFNHKEIEFYNTIARDAQGLPLIRCYDAYYSMETGASHILLDDVSQTHTQTKAPLPPSIKDCELAIDCIAHLHARFWEHPQWVKGQGRRADAKTVELIREILSQYVPAFAEFLGDRLPAERLSIYKRILAGPMRPWQRMIEPEGLTVSHGDAHWWNFLYPRDDAEERGYDGNHYDEDSNHAYANKAVIFDWHLWHVDIPLKDLAFMIALNWYPQRRARLEQPLLRRYHAALVKRGVKNFSWEDCWHDYRQAVIRELFVPVWQWWDRMEPANWWSSLERIWMAFEDLHCAELLDE